MQIRTVKTNRKRNLQNWGKMVEKRKSHPKMTPAKYCVWEPDQDVEESGNDATRAAPSAMAVATFLLEVVPRRSTDIRTRWSTSLLFLYLQSGCIPGPLNRNNRTLLYFLISRTRLLKASSTLIRCLADVSINLQLKCFAKSRPSVEKSMSFFEFYENQDQEWSGSG